MQRQPSPLFQQEAVCENVLLFDGMSRAGKGLVGPLVSQLPQLEFAQLVHAVDYIPTMWHFGLIEDTSAAAFLRMIVDTYSYQRMIGRNLNTRHSDIFTSVFKALDAEEILSRAFGADGAEPVKKFNDSGRYMTYITHETLPHADLWFRAYPKLRIILTDRHPIDLCYSWHSRGLGDRLGTDPLAFTPVADIDGDPIPLFALDSPKAYIEASPIDRILLCVLTMLDMYETAKAALAPAQREQVRIVCFERFATETEAELDRLASWLDSEIHPDMAIAMARERVPRKLDQSGRRARREALEREASAELFARLLEKSAEYEKTWRLESF
jgi:hypothetical protein